MRFQESRFELVLDRTSHQPLVQQLVLAITAQIRRGNLRPGDRVPSTRNLARELGVHRNTVVAAFEELVAQGWLETTPASHTRVTSTLPITETKPRSTRVRSLGFDLEPWINSSRSFEAVDGHVLDFTGGLPDARLFPSNVLARAFRRSLRRSADALLSFGDPAGDRQLRSSLATMLRSRGLSVSADDLFLTRGSQFALHLLSLALVGPGDTVAVESPGYPSAREAFSFRGASILTVPVDSEGMDVDTLASKLEHTSIRALYLTPHHQDPTTVTLSARRRLALLELARKHRFAIIEADYDYEFQFDGTPVLPMASSDEHGVVVYVGTLSKALAPGLRMGFVVAPPPLMATLKALRGQIDRQGDHAVERAIAELLDDGELVRHSLRARRVFHARRDCLVQLLSTHLENALDFKVPRGGLALWARAAEDIDVDSWAASCLHSGVRLFTGRLYDPRGRYRPFLRLGFGYLDESELESAVKTMARCVRSG